MYLVWWIEVYYILWLRQELKYNYLSIFFPQKVPYVGTIENGMAVGKAVQIKGVPTFDDDR